MPTLAAPLDCAKLEIRNERLHQLGTAPSSPVTGQLYYNTGDNTFYWWDNTQWVSARGGAASVPPATNSSLGTIQLAGDLGGNNSATAPQLTNLCVTDAKVATANKDGVAATPSMRTLGFGAQQALSGTSRLDQIAIPTASVNMNSQKIIGLGNPTSGTDAATKQYVDTTAQGLDVKGSCRVGTTANINLSSPGASIDGVTLATNDRVLVKDQTTTSQNGIYTFQGAASLMVRATDADIDADVTPGMFTFLEEGTQADSGWVLTTNAPIVVGTTGLTFTQFSGAGQIVAGTGMTKTANTLDVVGTTNRIVANADSIDIASNYVGQASITTLGTITTGAWNANVIPILYGGTGQSTATNARNALGIVTYYSTATHSAGSTISISGATHGVAAMGLIVQCQIAATGAVILPDITVSGSGDVTITFGASQGANTIRTTIIGYPTVQPA